MSQLQKKHPKKSNFKNKPKKTNDNPSGLIKALVNVKEKQQGSITFYYRDGSMRSMPFNMALFTDEKGDERRFGDIISILNDLKHDFKAVRYRVR